jgi:CoA:oxalate CoA-transferase
VTPRPLLEGVRVVDFTHVLAGPYATMMLADLGAEVWKIEKPGRGDTTRGTPPFIGGMSHYFSAINWNKKSVGIDIKDPRGRELVLKLVRLADVVIDNFRPATLEGLGLGYSVLRDVNPRIIRCAISGFGQDGPLASNPAFDLIIQAMAGFMSVTGEPDGPPLRTGVSIGDVAAGAFAVAAIGLALYQREQTGLGQEIDISMFDCLVSFLTYYLTFCQATGQEPPRVGSQHLSVVPMGAFRSADGYVAVAAFNQSFWRRMCTALGRDDLAIDPRFATMADRQRHREELTRILAAEFERFPTEEWVRRFHENDVPASPILTIGQVLDHPHTRARGLLKVIQLPEAEVRVAAQPMRFSSAGAMRPSPPPALGADTREVLVNVLGLDEASYTELQSAGVVS